MHVVDDGAQALGELSWVLRHKACRIARDHARVHAKQPDAVRPDEVVARAREAEGDERVRVRAEEIVADIAVEGVPLFDLGSRGAQTGWVC